MSISRLAVAAAAFSILCAMASASNIVGTWKGKLSLDKSKLPATITADKVKQAQDFFSKMSFTLTLKKDGTYTSKTDGGQGQPAPKPQSGKWTVKGNELTILIGAHSQKFTVAKNGKSFSAAQANGVMVTFTR